MESETNCGTEPTPRPGDPYLAWAISTGFRYLRPGRWLVLLVEFAPRALPRSDHGIRLNALELFARLEWLDDSGLRGALRVPELFGEPTGLLADIDDFPFSVLLVDRSRAAQVVADLGWKRTIIGVDVCPPTDLSEDRATEPPPPPVAPEPGFWACPLRWLRRWLRHWLQRLFQKGSVTDATYLATRAAAAQPAAVQRTTSSSAAITTQQALQGSGAALPAPRVVMAVLDEGIAFAHTRFRDASGTRIAYLWRQDAAWGPGFNQSTPGVELTASDIDAAVTAHTNGGRLDEDLLYQSLHVVDFSQDVFKAIARRRSHGTHVLDLAAGGEVTPQGSRPIIAVELPEASVADPVGGKLYAHIILGIAYVLARAASMRKQGERLPVVANVSYGPHEGPHDGSRMFERALDRLIAHSDRSHTPLTVVLAGGNFRQSRVHSQFALAAGATQTLSWRVQPECLTPSFVDLWFPANSAAAVTIKLTSPLSQTAQVSNNQPKSQIPAQGAAVGEMQFDAPSPRRPRPRVFLALHATATDPPLDASQPIAAPGVWTIEVTNTGAAALDIEAWIGRAGPIGGRRPKGRQSYFDDARYDRFAPDGTPVEYDTNPTKSYVARERTLSGITTGRHPIVIGAYRRLPLPQVGVPTIYTSMGPTSGAARTMKAPNFLAPADDSLVLWGVLAAGTRSASTVPMNGTSVAAPQAARWLADRIAAGAPIPPKPTGGLVAPPTAPPPPFVPPGAVDAVAGDGMLPLPYTRPLGR